MKTQELFFTHMQTPIGSLLLAGEEKCLHYLSFPEGKMSFGPDESWVQRDDILGEVRAQLKAYFAGELRKFDLPLKLSGTNFQNKTWQTLATIPFGQTRTYGWLAKAVGSPRASRAVGAANGANPIPIILPCHRVVGANGSLTGFGGGLPVKKYLLELEGVQSEADQMKLF